MASLPENHVAAESCVLPTKSPRETEVVEKRRTQSAEDSDPSDEEQTFYPEGGLQAWLVVFGSFCGM